jgi:FKBP-type peptidyl-prolyl cis-trans isomerase FkpA
MSLRFGSRLLLAACLAAGAVALPGSAQSNNTPGESKREAGKEVVTSSGLKYEDLEVGKGAEAKAGMVVEVLYTGWLANGAKFDSSRDRGAPYRFKLGAHQVIRGWDEGVPGMKVGGKRKLTIPSELGYGKQGAGGVIPPNAILIIEFELLSAS